MKKQQFLLKSGLTQRFALILPISLLMIFFMYCENPDNSAEVNMDLRNFEQGYLKEQFKQQIPLKSDTETLIHIIGFKTIMIPLENIDEFQQFLKDNEDIFKQFKNHFYDKVHHTYRIYFPLSTAYAVLEGDITEANEGGDLKVRKNKNLVQVEIIGRKLSDKIRGTGSNIVRNDSIILETKKIVDHIIESNGCVFDFGEICFMDDQVHPKLKEANQDNSPVSCMDNHNGLNCTQAFGIYNNGHCPFNPGTCMDYNGIAGNCKENVGSMFQKILNFIGSDCDAAMGAGHCWNEIGNEPATSQLP